jgi:hypothetical protein
LEDDSFWDEFLRFFGVGKDAKKDKSKSEKTASDKPNPQVEDQGSYATIDEYDWGDAVQDGGDYTMDLLGIFDPTGIVDGVHAAEYTRRGDYFNASLSGSASFIAGYSNFTVMPRMANGLNRIFTYIGDNVFFSGAKSAEKVAARSTKLLTQGVREFAGDQARIHYTKHGESVKRALGVKSYDIANYLDDANYIINSGTFVPELNGYIRLIPGQGSAKYGFVGINRETSHITTFHIKTAKELSRKVPSINK